MCAVEVSDSGLQQGQGMHGNFSRADTMNFMAAMGPDFKSGFVDEAPSSNADIGRTVAHILGVDIPHKGRLLGRVLEEALPGGAIPMVTSDTIRSDEAAKSLATVLMMQRVGETTYFDVAGFAGRTVGLDESKAARR
jgi:hypothetical protein